MSRSHPSSYLMNSTVMAYCVMRRDHHLVFNQIRAFKKWWSQPLVTSVGMPPPSWGALPLIFCIHVCFGTYLLGVLFTLKKGL